MKLNPDSIKPGESAFDAFPILLKYKEFKGGIGAIEAGTLMLYVLYAYSKDSELVRTIKDATKLKEAAAEKVGWKKKGKGGEYPDSIKSIIGFTDEKVRSMVNRLFRIQNDLEFEAYRTDLEACSNLLSELRNPFDPDADTDKKLKSAELILKISSGKQELLKRITEARQNLFENSEVEEVVRQSDLEESEYSSMADYYAKKAMDGDL